MRPARKLPTNRNQRSDAAKQYRQHYQSPRWRALRATQLAQEPLCRMCVSLNRVTAASVCDHVTPHKGDARLFFDTSNLQSLCAACHDAAKQREERHGFSGSIDASGWPTDPRHPANR